MRHHYQPSPFFPPSSNHPTTHTTVPPPPTGAPVGSSGVPAVPSMRRLSSGSVASKPVPRFPPGSQLWVYFSEDNQWWPAVVLHPDVYDYDQIIEPPFDAYVVFYEDGTGMPVTTTDEKQCMPFSVSVPWAKEKYVERSLQKAISMRAEHARTEGRRVSFQYNPPEPYSHDELKKIKAYIEAIGCTRPEDAQVIIQTLKEDGVEIEGWMIEEQRGGSRRDDEQPHQHHGVVVHQRPTNNNNKNIAAAAEVADPSLHLQSESAETRHKKRRRRERSRGEYRYREDEEEEEEGTRHNHFSSSASAAVAATHWLEAQQREQQQHSLSNNNSERGASYFSAPVAILPSSAHVPLEVHCEEVNSVPPELLSLLARPFRDPIEAVQKAAVDPRNVTPSVLCPIYRHARAVAGLQVNGSSVGCSLVLPEPLPLQEPSGQKRYLVVPLDMDGHHLEGWMETVRIEGIREGVDVLSMMIRVNKSTFDVPENWKVPYAHGDELRKAHWSVIPLDVTEALTGITTTTTTATATEAASGVVGKRNMDDEEERIESLRLSVCFTAEVDATLWCGFAILLEVERVPLDSVCNDMMSYAPSAHLKGGQQNLSSSSQTAVMSDRELVSLKCPVGLAPITYPCRGRHCTHLQCIDLITYLTAALQSHFWVCPICRAPMSLLDVRIDRLLCEFRASHPELPSTTRLWVDQQEGTYVPEALKKAVHREVIEL